MERVYLELGKARATRLAHRVGPRLRALYDAIVQEPLPKQWAPRLRAAEPRRSQVVPGTKENS
jgi:hypothetical protein